MIWRWEEEYKLFTSRAGCWWNAEGKEGEEVLKQQPRRKAGVSKGSPMENPEGVWVVQEGGAEDALSTGLGR